MNKMSEQINELVRSDLEKDNISYWQEDLKCTHLFVARPRCSVDRDHSGGAVEH